MDRDEYYWEHVDRELDFKKRMKEVLSFCLGNEKGLHERPMNRPRIDVGQKLKRNSNG